MEHLHTGTELIISDYLVDSVLYSVKCTSDGPHSNHAKNFVLNSIQTELKVVTKFSPANDGCEVRLDRSCDERRSVIIHGENAHSRFAFGTDDGFACKGCKLSSSNERDIVFLTGEKAVTAEAGVKAFGDSVR